MILWIKFFLFILAFFVVLRAHDVLFFPAVQRDFCRLLECITLLVLIVLTLVELQGL